ncbi:hypothetical protein D9M68_644310 [compost metagenome]
MEHAGFGEAELCGDVADAAGRVAELFDGEVLAQIVLDGLVRLAFLFQAPAQGRLADVEALRHAGEVRPLVVRQGSQLAAYARCEAADVAVAIHRQTAHVAPQGLQREAVLHHRQLQAGGFEGQRGLRLGEAEIGVEQQLVFVLALLLGVGEAGTEQRDAPPRQPAGDGVLAQQQDLVAQHARRLRAGGFLHGQAGMAVVAFQRAVEVVQQQVEVLRHALQRLAEGGAVDQQMAEHVAAADLHAPAVLAHEFVVEQA